MQVYIVTAGEYSEYHIERVFLDHTKAEAYSSLHPDSHIEVYDTYDNNFVIPSTAIFYTEAVFWMMEDADGHFHTFPAVSPFTTKFGPESMLACKTTVDLSCQRDYIAADRKILVMKITNATSAPSTETDFKPFEDRLRKIAYDVAAQVEEFFVESGTTDFAGFVKFFEEQHPLGVIPEDDSSDDKEGEGRS